MNNKASWKFSSASHGEIDSMVERTEIPKKDNQSNFGTGINYQIGDQEVELSMGEDWVIFKPWR